MGGVDDLSTAWAIYHMVSSHRSPQEDNDRLPSLARNAFTGGAEFSMTQHGSMEHEPTLLDSTVSVCRTMTTETR